MDRNRLLTRAVQAGQWAVTNQIANGNSADNGRYPRSFDVPTEQEWLASCWLQGVEMKALLALYEATGDDEYLQSCRRAARYLMSLQQMDARDAMTYGYIRETTPQTMEGHPRDALTAAWAMLLLHRAEPDERLLDRVLLFAEWFVQHGMDDRYPYWTVYLDGRLPFRQRGSFHGGSPGFLHDLFEATGEERWLTPARKILDFHIDTFLEKEGGLKITVAPDSGEDLTGKEDLAWEHMHKFNDDFTALAEMKLGVLAGEQKYTEAGLRFCRHLLANQQANGGFGDPVVPSASGVGALTLSRAAQVDPQNADKYTQAAERAVEHILSLQETESEDPRIRGGFYGQSEQDNERWQDSHTSRRCIHLRTTSYSTSALAMIGGRCRQSYYNVAIGG